MNRHHFISYSSADAQDFALRLCDELAQGPPPIPVWLDKRELVAGSDWDDQIVEAIRDCASLIFVMTRDSVTSKSVCKKEWARALKYKKPIIPLLLHPDAEMPFSLEPRQHTIGSYSNDAHALAKLYSENLRGARDAAETARQYNEPQINHHVLALLGVIVLRQGDAATAREAFAAAISETDQLLSYSAQNYDASDSRGLALCGLTLCDGVNRAPAAIESYRAARAVNKDAGVVAPVLRLFDALTVVDSAGALKEVRAAAAGE